MPVDVGLNPNGMLYQRDQYAKGGLGRRYWDFRDRVALSFLEPGVLLDVGCGEGITLERLVGAFPGSTVAGIDAEPENVAICRRYGLPVIAGDAAALPWGEATVDGVLLSEVIEHLDRPDPALAEIARVLRPGGRLVVVFPNDAAFLLARLLTRRFREAFYDAGHVRQWTPRAIRRSLAGHGLRVEASRSIPFGWWPLSLHHVVLARKGEER